MQTLPEEVVLQCLRPLDPEDLRSTSRVNRRLRSIALDNALWRPIARAVIETCQPQAEVDRRTQNALFDASAWWRDSPEIDASNAYFTLWNRLLRHYSASLGWWSDGEDLFTRVAAFNDEGCIRVEHFRLHGSRLRNVQRPHWGNPVPLDSALNALPGTLVASSSNGALHGIFIYSQGPSRIIYIDRVEPELLSVARGTRDIRLQDGLSYVPHPITADQHHEEDLSIADVWGFGMPAPYPPPALLPVMRNARLESSGRVLPQWVPSFPLSFETEHDEMGLPTTLIGSQTSTMFALNVPNVADRICLPSPIDSNILTPPHIIDDGLYTACYEPHGWELLYVTIRALTPSDFPSPSSSLPSHITPLPSPWPWDGHFGADTSPAHHGPFSGGSSPNEYITPGGPGARVGDFILEMTKVTGDVHVPKGQRSVIAFLDAGTGSVSPEVHEYMQAYRDRDRDRDRDEEPPLPLVSDRNYMAPWPIRRNEPGARGVGGKVYGMTVDEMMEREGEGWTLNGVGRIANQGFYNPSWTACQVHLESRTEILVSWLGTVMTFTRVMNP